MRILWGAEKYEDSQCIQFKLIYFCKHKGFTNKLPLRSIICAPLFFFVDAGTTSMSWWLCPVGGFVGCWTCLGVKSSCVNKKELDGRAPATLGRSATPWAYTKKRSTPPIYSVPWSILFEQPPLQLILSNAFTTGHRKTWQECITNLILRIIHGNGFF